MYAECQTNLDRRAIHIGGQSEVFLRIGVPKK